MEGYPDRILPKEEAAARVLKQRTLTNLYNEHPVWLAHAHRDLDTAVAAAYGWLPDLSDDEIWSRLFALNQSRAHTQSSAELLQGTQAQYPRYAPATTFKQVSRRQKDTDTQQAKRGTA